MQFVNLQELYQWAKVSPIILKAGRYKDVGSEARPMRDDERALLQDLLNRVHTQFKDAVLEGRNLRRTALLQDSEDIDEADIEEHLPLETLSRERVEEFGDGRIFTGEEALELGFVDYLGGEFEAVRLVAELANLGDRVHIRREIRERRPFRGLFDIQQIRSWLLEGLLALPVNETAFRLQPGVPYFLPPHMFSGEGR